MDCKIPFTYIAETQRSRMIISKTRSIAICYHTNAKTYLCVVVRVVQLEYLGRYMHQSAADTGIVLYRKLYENSCITIIYSRYIINLIKTFHWYCHSPFRALFEE